MKMKETELKFLDCPGTRGRILRMPNWATENIDDDVLSVRDGHGGGWSRKINAWHLYTLMVYL